MNACSSSSRYYTRTISSAPFTPPFFQQTMPSTSWKAIYHRSRRHPDVFCHCFNQAPLGLSVPFGDATSCTLRSVNLFTNKNHVRIKWNSKKKEKKNYAEKCIFLHCFQNFEYYAGKYTFLNYFFVTILYTVLYTFLLSTSKLKSYFLHCSAYYTEKYIFLHCFFFFNNFSKSMIYISLT